MWLAGGVWEPRWPVESRCRWRERPGAAPVARSYGLHAEELEPGADPHGSGRHRPRIRTRRPESSSPPCAPPRAAAAVSWSCPPAAGLVLPAGRSPGPARRPLAPRRHASARARAAPPRPLRSAAPTWGRERGLRAAVTSGAVATSGGLATSVRVVVGGGGGRGGRRSGARPPGAAPEAGGGSGGATVGIEREKGERAGRARGRLGRGRGVRGKYLV